MATSPDSGASKKPSARKAAPAKAGAADAVAKMEEDLAPTAIEPRSTIFSRLFAEFIGTGLLMFGGLSASVYAGVYGGTLVVPFAWGLTLLALIVALAHVSGAHFNPAVTVGLWIAGRVPARDVLPYVLVQVVGAVVGAAGVLVSLSAGDVLGNAEARDYMLGISILHSEGSQLGLGVWAAITVEFVLTGLLVAAVLSTTSRRAPTRMAPVAIPAALCILIVIGIPATNASLNPARATATWLLNGEFDVAQLWPWWVSGILAGLFVGLMYRAFGPEEDIVED